MYGTNTYTSYLIPHHYFLNSFKKYTFWNYKLELDTIFSIQICKFTDDSLPNANTDLSKNPHVLFKIAHDYQF